MNVVHAMAGAVAVCPGAKWRWLGALGLAGVLLVSGCAGFGLIASAENETRSGLALLDQGKFAESIPYFERAIELDPDYADAYLYLGRAYLSQGKWIEAISPLRTAYRLKPPDQKADVITDLVEGLIRGALTRFQQGELRDSVGLLREALQVEPASERAQGELVSALVALGGRQLSEGRWQEAGSLFSEAIQLAPDNQDAYLGLAKSFFNSGDVSKALEAIMKIIASGAASPDAQQLFKQLMQSN